MTFTQRLSADFYAKVHADIRAHMAATGVDVLVSAPQKGWSGPACCALVMLGTTARERIDATTSITSETIMPKSTKVWTKVWLYDTPRWVLR